MSDELERQQFEWFMREYVCAVRWQNAKTYQHFAPHEYTVSEWNDDRRPWFERVVLGIRRFGYRAQFGKHRFVYYDLDGKKYWTMGESINSTTLINRTDAKNNP